MDIKINVDVNVKLDGDTKGFLNALIDSMLDVTESRDKRPQSGTAYNGGASTAPETTPIYTEPKPTDVAIDPAARLSKPKTSKGARTKAEDTTPKDTTHHETSQEPQGEAQAATSKETPPPQLTVRGEDIQRVDPTPEATPDTTQDKDSSPSMSDTEFRQEVSKVYLLAEGEAKPKVAKALYELLSKFEAPTVNKVDAEKRPEFLKMFTFVTNKLVKG